MTIQNARNAITSRRRTCAMEQGVNLCANIATGSTKRGNNPQSKPWLEQIQPRPFHWNFYSFSGSGFWLPSVCSIHPNTILKWCRYEYRDEKTQKDFFGRLEL